MGNRAWRFLSYLGCPDVNAAYEELVAKGIEVQKSKVVLYGIKQMYLKDPERYGVCFQWTA